MLHLLTWPCMVCGDERLDDFIAVAHRPAPWFEDQFPETRMDVRYCTDRDDCATIANAAGPWQGPPDPAVRTELAASIRAWKPDPLADPPADSSPK